MPDDLSPEHMMRIGLIHLSFVSACFFVLICSGHAAGQAQESTNPANSTAAILPGEQSNSELLTRSIKTKSFAYVRNFSPAVELVGDGDQESGIARPPHEELYDLTKDANQRVNLVDDPKYAKDRVRLSNQLTQQFRDAGDPLFKLPGHATFLVRGWKVHLNDSLWRDQPAKTKMALSLLAIQLDRVVEAVPEKALSQIRKVPIWINPTPANAKSTAEFHPGEKWLRDNNRDPAMVKSVELTNVMNFQFENRRMPLLLLHEMAHAYHNLVLDFRNPEIRAAFESAKASGDYDQVQRFTGRKMITDKAYGMNNEKEYFAESSEAYFGKNDFFPFNRQELRTHDPKMHDLVKQLWGDESAAQD